MIRIDHVGIAVQDVEGVKTLFERLFQAMPDKTEDVPSQGVRTHFIQAGETKIELLESLDDSSPIARYLSKHGEGVHHLAFDVPDIDAVWKRVVSLGYEPIGDGPSPGADDKLIFFLHPRQTHGLLIEFCQSRRPSTKSLSENLL